MGLTGKVVYSKGLGRGKWHCSHPFLLRSGLAVSQNRRNEGQAPLGRRCEFSKIQRGRRCGRGAGSDSPPFPHIAFITGQELRRERTQVTSPCDNSDAAGGRFRDRSEVLDHPHVVLACGHHEGDRTSIGRRDNPNKRGILLAFPHHLGLTIRFYKKQYRRTPV